MLKMTEIEKQIKKTDFKKFSTNPYKIHDSIKDIIRDSVSNVKIGNILGFIELSGAEQKVLGYIISTIKNSNNNTAYLSPKLIHSFYRETKINYSTENYSKAITKLLEKNIIAKTFDFKIYWINNDYIWKI